MWDLTEKKMSGTLINNLKARIRAGTFLDKKGKISIKYGFK